MAAHADLDAACMAQADGLHRGLVGAVQATEAVVGFLQSVDADTDIVVADAGNAVDHAFVDERAVGGQADVKAHGLGTARDVEDIGPQQRLAAGQDQHRDMKTLEVVHHLIDFSGGQLAGEVGVGGNRVAVLAGEVAAPDQIPDHHRTGRIAFWPERCRVRNFLHVLRDAKHQWLLGFTVGWGEA